MKRPTLKVPERPWRAPETLFIAAASGRRPRKAMTLTQTAKYLHCSVAHVTRLLSGKVAGAPPLPCIQNRRNVSISRRALNTWLWDLEAIQRKTRQQQSRRMAGA